MSNASAFGASSTNSNVRRTRNGNRTLDLIDVAARLDGNPKAVLFRHLRGCDMELVGTS